MARDLPIGNGNIHINFDSGYRIRDIYYPYVGLENHSPELVSRFGVYCDDRFQWLDDPAFAQTKSYWDDTLITNVECEHAGLGLSLRIQDGVDSESDAMFRKLTVRNRQNRERTVKLYFHLNLNLYGSAFGDTVYYDPDLKSLVFYKGARYISLSGRQDDAGETGLSGYAAGQKGIRGLEGTWRDAEDGALGGNPISQGAIDGVAELVLKVPANGEANGWFWLCFGTSVKDIVRLEAEVRSASPVALFKRTYDYWRGWIAGDKHTFEQIEPDLVSLYKTSLLVLRTNFDNRGAVMAANDSDILKFAKDTYSYMWPRDGALIAHSLDRAGFHRYSRKFFDFCISSLSTEGFLMHKYNADGSAGSSWHPWVNAAGEKQFPIQEDETALVVFALWHHHRLAGTTADSRDDYDKLVVPAASFLLQYRDASGLPLPSYDLWEERYGVLAFTVSTVYAGLLAAADFADTHGDRLRRELYRDAAGKMKEAVEAQMYCGDRQRFVRALYWNADTRSYERDYAIDASMYALFDFELFAADDPRIERTMREMKEKLWVRTDIGGMARYENDYYHQVSRDIANVPGNPWFICTLWYAEWLIARAKTEDELNEPLELIRWARRRALPTGIMAEQIDPYTGAPLSVSPLTWSHASFIKVLQEYDAKRTALRGGGGYKESERTKSDRELLVTSGTGGEAP
ncbi:glycoside hydrolase family 15 protein [Paenibacillus flagellatus]|uniref:Glycoside hydrolase family 15 protein n=1 Tax=Paenibacillus flagellatus TaxID=2211139 RepID=A0A2V5K602_9BACL|nr:glycoside hydrolase family 15 protein [Paenibacillus flagellatus]PYI54799.1 glycoside hydrolase family 15 protein [Paenibacillus flagellatus]